MTHSNLVVFIIFLCKCPTETLQVDYKDNVSQELFVSRYACTKMQENHMY